jgi:hypothetical protein
MGETSIILTRAVADILGAALFVLVHRVVLEVVCGR